MAMGILFPVFFTIEVLTGATIPALLLGLPDNDDKTHDARAIVASHAMIHINATDLRGSDVQKLQGLQIDFINADTAFVSTGDFRVKSNVTIHPHSEASKGYINGALSFRIPGLDTETDGTFLVVNKTAADDKTKDDFEKVYAFMQEERSQPTDPREAIARIAQAL